MARISAYEKRLHRSFMTQAVRGEECILATAWMIGDVTEKTIGLKGLQTAGPFREPTAAVTISRLTAFPFVNLQLQNVFAEDQIVWTNVLCLAFTRQRDLPSVVVDRNRLMAFQYEISVRANVRDLCGHIERQLFTSCQIGVGAVDLTELSIDLRISSCLWGLSHSPQTFQFDPAFENGIVYSILSLRRATFRGHSCDLVNAYAHRVMYSQHTRGGGAL